MRRDTPCYIMIDTRDWPLGDCVPIRSFYRDKQAVWMRACHDTIDCIVIGGQRLGRWLCHDTDATRPRQALRYNVGVRA